MAREYHSRLEDLLAMTSIDDFTKLCGYQRQVAVGSRCRIASLLPCNYYMTDNSKVSWSLVLSTLTAELKTGRALFQLICDCPPNQRL